MDTAVWILIVALMFISLGTLAYFLFAHVFRKNAAPCLPPCQPVCNDGSNSMAGHLIGKMKKAQRHARKALEYSNKASRHSNKAFKHTSNIQQPCVQNTCNTIC